jgi:hypothetical protein
MMQSSRWLRTAVPGTLAAAVLLLGGGAAGAQERNGQKEEGRDIHLGFGAGLVDPEDSASAEVYYSAALRIRLGQGGDFDEEGGQWEGDHYKGKPPTGGNSGGIRGYIEPEIAYWSGGGDNESIEDLLAGVNLVGVVPTRGADYFLGVGFGVHFFDAELRREVAGVDTVIVDDDTHLGGNLQVGVDVNVSESTALFGTGRIDILEGEIAERQSKVYIGIRMKF